jgi:hypothetical protein
MKEAVLAYFRNNEYYVEEEWKKETRALRF